MNIYLLVLANIFINCKIVFHCLAGLSLSKRLYSITDTFSKALQSPAMTASNARALSEETCTLLQALRDTFGDFLKEVNEKSEKLGKLAITFLSK